MQVWSNDIVVKEMIHEVNQNDERTDLRAVFDFIMQIKRCIKCLCRARCDS